MTNQYYDPNQQGQYAQQPQQGYYPQQPAPQGYAPNPYGQQVPQGYAPQQYPGQQMMQPQPPQQDLSGDLDSFYAQRNTGGGKGVSWKGVPDGYNISGVVSRQITNGDVFKETYPPNSPQAGQIRTNRDGSPKYAMQVPLKLMNLDPFQQRDYPEGEARLFLRGGLRDEVTRAMAEAGAPAGPPEAGAFIRVTLTHRKPGNNIATNMFAVLYRSPGQWENDPSLTQFTQQQFYQPPSQPAQSPATGQVYGGAPNQGPYQQQAPAQYAAPAQPAPNPQQYAAQQYGQQAYDPNVASNWIAQPNTPQAPVQDQLPYGGQQVPQGAVQQPQPPVPPQAPVQQPVQPQPPVQTGVQPSGLDPAKQALLNRLGGQQAPQGQ